MVLFTGTRMGNNLSIEHTLLLVTLIKDSSSG